MKQVLLCCALTAILFAGCFPTDKKAGGSEKEKGKETKVENAAGTAEARDTADYYISKSNGFSIMKPKGWDVKENYSASIPVFFISKIEGPSDRFTENINIAVERVGSYGLNAYYDASIANLKKGLTDANIIGDVVDGETNGVKYKKVIFEYSYEGTPIKALDYIIVSNERGYVITCASAPKSFDKFKPKFEEIANTFKAEN
jgi:PsbP